MYPFFCNFRKFRYLCISNRKARPSRASFRPDFRLQKSTTSPDGGIGRRAGLKHQWSNPCRFDPGSGYKQKTQHYAGSFACTPSQPQSAALTAPFRVASGKETAQWAFPTSSLRQPDRLYRPLPMVGSGVPAAAIFCENLADADDAALMRLVISLKTALYPSELRLLD